MFELEREVEQWRRAMAAAGLRAPEIVRELEEHLREDIERQIRTGTSAPMAFKAAVERIGPPSALKHEFDLAAPTSGVGALQQHKGKIMLCAGIGLLAAVALSVIRAPSYQSEVKFLLRYQFVEGGDVTQAASLHQEVEILTSSTLAQEVTETIGADRILNKAGGGQDLTRATMVIREGLRVAIQPNSSVIRIAFRHPDSSVIQRVLRETIDRYLRMHVELHRKAGEPRPGRVTNISQINPPSPPVFEFTEFFRLPTLLLATGIFAGFAWVLVIKLSGNHSGHPRREAG